MKFQWSIICSLLTIVFMASSCKEKKESLSKDETPNEAISKSKQKGMEQAREWKGEERMQNDTASYENQQNLIHKKAQDSAMEQD
ncbi:hypothetical protein [Galbibacter orientalis]|uniref:hypothetical protein n=1 Tax=Galbibacter orientalis TaxID=453852 RepID=UPI00300255A4